VRLDDAEVRGRLEPADGPWNSQPDLRDAAVALILVERGGVDHVLFTRRRDDLPWHAGQVSFPGGAREGDESPAQCAVREACEELGLDARDLSVIGRLPDRFSIARFWVASFVARLRGARSYEPQLSEVAEVFEVACAALFERERWSERPVNRPGARFRKLPYFDYEERTVWGLTAIILRDFVTAIRGDPLQA
jgi:8-oxo-dGTP pyrophosphatase MutT (NUDIX family)